MQLDCCDSLRESDVGRVILGADPQETSLVIHRLNVDGFQIEKNGRQGNCPW